MPPQPPETAETSTTSDAARTLVVVRHAKAEAAGPTDAERELTEGGCADAHSAGEWLASLGTRPGVALVSAAVRARRTWDCLAEAAGWDVEPELDPSLYTAGAETVLDLLRALDPAATTAVVVGHNPTMGTLAQLLDDGDGDPRAETAMLGGFPTTAVAVFAVPVPWTDLGPATGTLRAFHVGRAG